MARIHVFGDEAGNFDFSTRPGASKYFILGTIVLDNPNVGEQLLRLRRDLAWRRFGLDSSFHATTDPQVIRDEVFSVIENLDFRIDSTIFEKRKAIPSLQIDERLYKTAWFYHLRHVIPATVQLDDDLMVVAASIGTRKRRRAIRNGIEDVVRQVSNTPDWRVAFWPSESDPCLQIADYCVWAIQRKYERQDDRSYDLIRDKIQSEYQIWAAGPNRY